MKQNIGQSMNQTMYDQCKTTDRINAGNFQLEYQMFSGKFINEKRCGGNAGTSLSERIDRESELMNITRPLSNCAEMKYQPNCDSSICKGTFKMDPTPVPFDMCPIIENNMPKIKNPGFVMKNTF